MSTAFVDSGLTSVGSTARSDERGPRGLHVARLDSFEEATALRAEWDALVVRVGGDVFNTFDWCATWWKHFGHRRALTVYIARRGAELVAVWPLFRERIAWGPLGLRVVRVVGCDHGVTTCNLTTEPTELVAVAEAIVGSMEAAGPWDLLHVGEIPGYADGGAALAEAFRRSSPVGEVRFDSDAYPHAVFDVPADYEAYLARLSIKERRNVRHDERELAKQGGNFHEPKSVEELNAAWDTLVDLHRRHWAARGRFGHFDDVPGVEAFHREIAQKSLDSGRLGMVEVRTSQGAIASEYALRFNNRLHWIIGGRREDVSSRVGFCALMHGAVRDGVTLIDGLPGAYDYKRRLGARSLGVKMISVLPKDGRGAWRLAMTRATAQFVSLVYHRAWFWHLAPWLVRKAPHLSLMLIRPGLWERFARSRFLVVARHRSEETLETSRETK